MPRNLCATYAPLYRLSCLGVMLLNASIVEPGYYGPLSCFLVNFSSQAVPIALGGPIAKITFHELNAAPGTPQDQIIDDVTYHAELSKSARKFQKTFMDIANIADRAAEKATQSAKKAVIYGGVILTVLLAWAQFEPFVSTLVRRSVGWPTNAAERTADDKTRLELEGKLKELELTRKAVQLEAEIQTLKAEVLDLKSKVKK